MERINEPHMMIWGLAQTYLLLTTFVSNQYPRLATPVFCMRPSISTIYETLRLSMLFSITVPGVKVADVDDPIRKEFLSERRVRIFPPAHVGVTLLQVQCPTLGDIF